MADQGQEYSPVTLYQNEDSLANLNVGELVKLLVARNAVHHALEKLLLAEPHSRDYLSKEALNNALQEFQARLGTLINVYDKLVELLEGIANSPS